MKMYSLTAEELSETLNDAKTVFVDGLFMDGVIDKETHRSIKEDYAIILVPSSMFGRAIRESLGWEKEKDYYKLIKLNLNNKDNNNVHQSKDSDTEGVDNGSD